MKELKFRFNTSRGKYHTIANLLLIATYNTVGYYEKSLPLAEVIEKGFKGDHLKLAGNEERVLIAYFNLFNTYFALKKYKKANFFLNQITDRTWTVRSDYVCMAKIVAIIIHFEMGKFDLMDYAARSAYRHLKRKNRMYQFEEAILEYIGKNISKETSNKNITDSFIELNEKVQTIFEDTFEAKVLEFFDFTSWLEAKIAGKDFAAVVREKGEKLVEMQ